MSDGITIALMTVTASIVSVLITQGVAYWINKRKLPSEIKKLDAEGRLNNGSLTEKYQQIAAKQADENIELGKELKNKEVENKNLAKVLDELRQEIKTMDQRHEEEIREVELKFQSKVEELELDNRKWRDWARRLVLQLNSLGFVEVPFDVEEARKKGYSLGDMGNYTSNQAKPPIK